jgi:hypothetical protein
VAFGKGDVEVEVHRALQGDELVPGQFPVLDDGDVIQIRNLRSSHHMSHCPIEQPDGQQLSDDVFPPEGLGEDADVKTRPQVDPFDLGQHRHTVGDIGHRIAGGGERLRDPDLGHAHFG